MVKKREEVEEIKLKKKKKNSQNTNKVKKEINENNLIEQMPKKRKNTKKKLEYEIVLEKKKKTTKKRKLNNNKDIKRNKNINNKNNNTSIKNNKNINCQKKNNANIKNNTNINNNNIVKIDKKNEDKLGKKRKFKNGYKIVSIILLLLTITVLIIIGVGIFKRYQQKLADERISKERSELVATIKSHYNNYVVVAKDTKLYRIDENNNYYEYGVVYKDTELILGEIDIDYQTEYFYSVDLDCYVKYNDLKIINELSKRDERYKNYIVFNQNIVTNDNFSLYDSGNNMKVYTFRNNMSFPIIIKNDEDKYYVEFNNRLLYVLKDDVKEIINVNNTKLLNASKVTTLCYHRIYDSTHKCNDLYICKSKNNFEREMKYLSDNNFFTLTMNEMYLYLTNKIQIPQKSVVLTFDDGTLFELGIEILEKYNLHGTGFIKTGTFSDYSVYESPNFELQSHTDKMHVAGTCRIEKANQQGGGILCLPESTVLNDLKASREKLNGSIALAYPFYDYNDRAIELVKKSGFKLAFIGADNVMGRSYPGINLYKVPRMTIWDTTTFESFKRYVDN